MEYEAKEKLHPVDKAQVLLHLWLSGLHVGLLVNFHELVPKDGLKRIVSDHREE